MTAPRTQIAHPGRPMSRIYVLKPYELTTAHPQSGRYTCSRGSAAIHEALRQREPARTHDHDADRVLVNVLDRVRRVHDLITESARATPYDVPYGAFPTSAPYVNFAATEPPVTGPRSSTSPDLAHPFTTRRVPQNSSGVKESSAVRFREAQGELHTRGGSDGGLGLMDKASTKPGDLGELPSSNPPPDAPGVAEKFSAMGVDHAWKARK